MGCSEYDHDEQLSEVAAMRATIARLERELARVKADVESTDCARDSALDLAVQACKERDSARNELGLVVSASLLVDGETLVEPPGMRGAALAVMLSTVHRAETAERSMPLCECGRIAVCIGSSERGIECCCDDCCGHGQEDSSCVPISDVEGWVRKREDSLGAELITAENEATKWESVAAETQRELDACRVARDAWALQCDMASEAQADALSDASKARSEASDAMARAESAELGCEIAYRREPTPAEGEAYAHQMCEGAIVEAHVPMGNWHGHRCTCGKWVWGGGTVCQRCVDAQAVRTAVDRAVEAEQRALDAECERDGCRALEVAAEERAERLYRDRNAVDEKLKEEDSYHAHVRHCEALEALREAEDCSTGGGDMRCGRCVSCLSRVNVHLHDENKRLLTRVAELEQNAMVLEQQANPEGFLR